MATGSHTGSLAKGFMDGLLAVLKMKMMMDFYRTRGAHYKAQEQHWRNMDAARGQDKDPTASLVNEGIRRYGGGEGGGGGGGEFKSTADAQSRAQEMSQYLQDKWGLSKAGAAGVIGNAWQEHGFKTGLEATGDKDANGNFTSGGMFQWHLGRLTQARDWMAQNNRDPNDWKAHIDYAMTETQRDHPDLLNFLRATDDPVGATHTFFRHFEGGDPNRANFPNREGMANVVFKGTAPGEKPAATTTSSDSGHYFIGVTISQGLQKTAKGDGKTKVGDSSASVLKTINSTSADDLKGKKIVLSTGLINSTNDTNSVAKQIDALVAKGVDPADINVVGVGSQHTDLNATLQSIAEKAGAVFKGGFKTGKDGIHPQSYGSTLKQVSQADLPTNQVAGGTDEEAMRIAIEENRKLQEQQNQASPAPPPGSRTPRSPYTLNPPDLPPPEQAVPPRGSHAIPPGPTVAAQTTPYAVPPEAGFPYDEPNRTPFPAGPSTQQTIPTTCQFPAGPSTQQTIPPTGQFPAGPSTQQTIPPTGQFPAGPSTQQTIPPTGRFPAGPTPVMGPPQRPPGPPIGGGAGNVLEAPLGTTPIGGGAGTVMQGRTMPARPVSRPYPTPPEAGYPPPPMPARPVSKPYPLPPESGYPEPAAIPIGGGAGNQMDSKGYTGTPASDRPAPNAQNAGPLMRPTPRVAQPPATPGFVTMERPNIDQSQGGRGGGGPPQMGMLDLSHLWGPNPPLSERARARAPAPAPAQAPAPKLDYDAGAGGSLLSGVAHAPDMTDVDFSGATASRKGGPIQKFANGGIPQKPTMKFYGGGASNTTPAATTPAPAPAAPTASGGTPVSSQYPSYTLAPAAPQPGLTGNVLAADTFMTGLPGMSPVDLHNANPMYYTSYGPGKGGFGGQALISDWEQMTPDQKTQYNQMTAGTWQPPAPAAPAATPPPAAPAPAPVQPTVTTTTAPVADNTVADPSLTTGTGIPKVPNNAAIAMSYDPNVDATTGAGFKNTNNAGGTNYTVGTDDTLQTTSPGVIAGSRKGGPIRRGAIPPQPMRR